MAGSSTGDAQRPSLGARLRSVTWSKVAFMAGLLAVGFALVHFAERGGRKVSEDEAVAIARTKIDFEPTGYQIRFLRRGVPPRGYWITSLYIRRKTGAYERVTVVVIDAASGAVTEVHRTT